MSDRGFRFLIFWGLLVTGTFAGHGLSLADEKLPEVHIGAPAGTNRYWKNTWGIVGVDVSNPRERPAMVQALVYFEQDPNQQFGRTFWVPAGAKRQSWCPVLVPDITLKAGQMTIEMRTMAWDVSAAERRALRPPKMATEGTVAGRKGLDGVVRPILEQLNSQQNVNTVLLPIGQEKSPTGLFVDKSVIGPSVVREWEDRSGAPIDFGYEATVAMQFVYAASRRVQLLEDRLLPPTEESLQGVDRLVVRDNRLATDSAAAVAVRGWLHRGGRLWIMLDQVDEATVGLLLGDALDLEVVERVGVTQAQLTNFDGTPASQLRRFPAPVPLARVLVPGVEPIHTIDGWPASFWVQVGRGRVLFTTLGAQAWLQSGAGKSQMRSDIDEQANFHATDALELLAGDFMQRTEPADASLLQSLLTKQIGYEVVSRNRVLLVLGGFCLLLPLAGVWLQRRSRMERLAWLAPGLAVLAAAVLLGHGISSRQAVEATVASAQLVEGAAGSGQMSVTGMLGIYNREESQQRIGALRGGTFIPNLPDSGTTRGMIWTGLDDWHWENLSLPAGVRLAPFHLSLNTSHPVEARGQFGPQGLAVTVAPGLFKELGDALIVTPGRQRLACRPTEDSGFLAGPGDLLASDQFLAGSLLTDQQAHRQTIYRALFDSPAITQFESQLRLVAWADGLDTGFDFPGDIRQVSSSLVTLALRFDRTPPNTDVVIPAPFLSPRSVAGPGVSTASSLFNHRTGQWVEGERDAQIWLRFQLPAEVLPIQLQRATLTINLRAPQWRLEVSQLADSAPVPLTTRDNLADKLELQLPAESLRTDSDGGLVVGLKITRLGPVDQPLSWTMDYVRLEVAGRTASP